MLPVTNVEAQVPDIPCGRGVVRMVEEQTQQESKGSLTKKGKKRSRPVDPSADPPADPPADPSAVIKKAGKTSAEQKDVAEGGRPTKPNNREVKRREAPTGPLPQ